MIIYVHQIAVDREPQCKTACTRRERARGRIAMGKAPTHKCMDEGDGSFNLRSKSEQLP